MSQQTKKPFQELLNTQNSTEEIPTNKENSFNEKFTYKKLENTPFHIIGDDEKGYILVSGTFQLTEYMSTPNLVEEYFDTHPWEICITLITMVIHMNKQIETFNGNIDNKIQQKLEG